MEQSLKKGELDLDCKVQKNCKLIEGIKVELKTAQGCINEVQSAI